MSSASSPRRRALGRLAAVAGALAAAAACGRIISPPPPPDPPRLTHEIVVSGAPVTIAARGARTLNRFSYNTRRFGPDSTWGFRAVDSVAVRLRYSRPSDDSTRVLIEFWAKCQPRQPCLREDLYALLTGLQSEEGPPQ